MNLGAFFFPTGHHIAAWRHPDGVPDAGVNLENYRQMAEIAERGLFDLIFLADTHCSRDGIGEKNKRLSYLAWIDPFTMCTALAMLTKRIGIVCTASTTFEEPYALARRFGSLDVLSGGRCGWNIVTSSSPWEAKNYGMESHRPTVERYERAAEFAEVAQGLWDSWDDDAFVHDKEAGLFAHPEKSHILGHVGKHFKVRGPLNVPRSPQGQPVRVQAGQSEDGRQLASTIGEAIFTAQPDFESAKSYYQDVKKRAAAAGRNPDHVKIMPGFTTTVGRSRAEAEDKAAYLEELIHPEVGIGQLSHYLNVDLSKYPIDGPFPELPENVTGVSRIQLIADKAKRENLTIRQLYKSIGLGRGHHQATGTASDIADQMEEWFKGDAADGFNVMCSVLPSGLNEFVEMIVPELQRRGLYRRQYEGATLRDHLGLPRPASRYSAAA